MNDLVERLRKRAEIRLQIPTRKAVQEGKPDRLAELLIEAADEIEYLRTIKREGVNSLCHPLVQARIAKFMQECKDDPSKAPAFLRKAGIINEEGRLIGEIVAQEDKSNCCSGYPKTCNILENPYRRYMDE